MTALPWEGLVPSAFREVLKILVTDSDVVGVGGGVSRRQQVCVLQVSPF